MTVITETAIESGQEAAWDDLYHQRFEDARTQPGWVAMQLLIPADAPNSRVVVGTWQRREDWEKWHATDTFARTREQMNRLTQSHGQDRWYEVAAGPTIEA